MKESIFIQFNRGLNKMTEELKLETLKDLIQCQESPCISIYMSTKTKLIKNLIIAYIIILAYILKK